MNRNILKKLGAVALSALMTLGVTSQSLNTVEASSHNLEYYGQTTAWGTECGNYSIDGRRAWCIEHKKDSPPAGVINGDVYKSTEGKFANMRKIMYYGWQGYEQWNGMNNLSDIEKNTMMSIALSHAYSGSEIRQQIIKDFYNFAVSQPDPLNKNVLKFSKQIVNVWYDKDAKVQKSESSTLNGPSNYHVTINPQTSKVRVVNETRGTSGQIVDVYGGDTVHYEADADYTGNSYSGWLKGGFQFAPLIVWNNNASQQHISTWVITDPDEPTCLNADFKAVVGSLRLRKTDTGGKLLNGAVFHVSGNGYEQDVTVENGEITVNELPAGDYTITEKTAPNGYLVNVAPFKTTVVAGQTAETTITDEAPTGKISIKKSDSEGNIQGEASLEGAEYTVYGADGQEVGKITTDKDGNGSLENLVLGTYTVKETKAPEAYDLDWNTYTVELTYKDQNTAIILGNVDSKENVKTGMIEIKKTDTEGNPLKSGEFGIYANADMYIGATLYKKGQLVMSIKTDENGMAESDILPYGSYYVKELKAPSTEDGNKENFVLSDETQHVKITGYSSARMLIVATPVAFIDKKVYVTKTDVTGSKEIKGAQLQVTDLNGEIMDSWVSDGQPHSIKGLIEGHDYILTETSAPDGYVKAQSIKFSVSKEKKDETIVMKDTQVKVSKTDVSGKKELEGAKLEVRNEFNQVVDSWTSTKDPHFVNGLEEGKTYRLVETEAPKGYVKAKDVFFTVSNEKKNESVVMKDAKITASKTEVTGTKEVEGAKMTVTDEKGKTVDEWTSGKEEHSISGLEEGKKYTLTETTAPKGYVKAESITFTAGDKDQMLVMKDKQVSVTKTDITGTQEVPGATLTVKDEDGNTVDTWVSGDKEHHVSGLEEGKTYTLIEETAPEGYVRAEEITFTVTKENVDQEVNMFDAQVKVTKTDALTGDAVKGAEFTVFDKDGNIVDKWTTDGTAHAVSGLDAGCEYVLKETKTPEGYMTAPDRTLVVSGEQNMDVEIKEQPVLTDIEVQKVDAQTKKVIKSKDFEFTMYSDAECKNAITTVSADKNAGTATFKDLRYGTYYIKETKAPTGYLLSKEVKKVVIDDNLENVGKTYSFVYQDTPMPTTGVKTGDGTDIQKFTALTGISGIVLLICVILIIRKKKNAQ